MTSATLSELIADDPFSKLRDAIVAGLKTRIAGVAIEAHPGKLDIYDVISKSSINAPAVLIGWTSIKGPRSIDGSFTMPVDWAAYIIAEDFADLATSRRIERDVVAHAIGMRLLSLLHDPENSSWGLPGVCPPDGQPGPALKPLFTATAFEKGVSYYAVTWTQGLVDLGPDLVGGATPEVVWPGTDQEHPIGGLKFATEEDIPPEVAAMIAASGEGEI